MRPKRTGKTSLTHDELTLFDVLFDKGLALEHLYRKDFRFFHNRYDSHSLTRAQVRNRISRWIQAGWVRSYPVDDDEPDLPLYYALTPQGGHLWELEREPLWDRFCIEFGVYVERRFTAVTSRRREKRGPFAYCRKTMSTACSFRGKIFRFSMNGRRLPEIVLHGRWIGTGGRRTRPGGAM